MELPAEMLFLHLLINLLGLSESAILNFTKYHELHSELTSFVLQDDVMSLISDLVKKTNPSSVGLIFDSIFSQHVNDPNVVSSLSSKNLISMLINDWESFEDEPSQEVQSLLIKMKEMNCALYVILITNGIQMAGFLKYTDQHRLINTRAKIVMLHDNRLFTSEMLFIWKRFVNVVFIRETDIKHRTWYELSTVPFPERIGEVFNPRFINYWSPTNQYRFPGEIFATKANNDLNGVKLLAAVLIHTPTVYKKTSPGTNDSIQYFGLEIDVINTLSTAMNFSVDFYESSDTLTEKWGRELDTGNFSGLYGEMSSAQADIALGDLHYTMFNLDVMDLSIPYNTECLTFITPELIRLDESWKTLLAPFSLEMWVGVMMSLALIGIVFFTFSNIYTVPYVTRDFFDSLHACILYTYSMILVVSLPRLPDRWSVRVLTGWWWIYSVLVVVAYRASLTSILANPVPRITIDSIDSLAKSWLKCGAWGDQNKNFFLSSIDTSAQNIGSKLEHVDDADEAIKRVAVGDFAYFENQYTLQQLRFNHEEKHKESTQNLHIMEQCAIVTPVSIGLEKNSPLKEEMDKYIRRMIEAGLVKKWLMNAVQSFESSVENSPEEALMDLKKFYGALVALGCGYAVAFLAFVVEIVYWKLVVEKHPNFDKYYGKIVTVSGFEGQMLQHTHELTNLSH